MKRMLLIVVLVGGCAPYTGAERSLVLEALKGTKLVAQAEEVRRRQSEAVASERRARLDEAFDADVREQKSLDADWVIEQRRAYSAAVDLLAQQSAADKQLAATTLQNLGDIDLALQKLELMIDVQEKVLDVKSFMQQEGK